MIVPFILCFLLFIFICYLAYLVWFLPSKFLDHAQRSKQRTSKLFPFIPKWYIDLAYYCGHDNTILWMIRIMTTIFIGMTLFALIMMYMNMMKFV